MPKNRLYGYFALLGLWFVFIFVTPMLIVTPVMYALGGYYFAKDIIPKIYDFLAEKYATLKTRKNLS